MDVRGRVVVVTGAAGGIGSALVRALVAAGAEAVVATDLRLEAVEAVAAAASPGARVLPRRLDVTDEAATRELVADVAATVGSIDLWFANAGLAAGGGPEEPDATWDAQWRVNVMAHVHATRALLPAWLERGEGHLVTTASMAGILTTLGDGVYAATKHAAVGYAEWLAITYGDQGIRVSCVCPGAVDTDMLRGTAGGDADKAAAVIGGGEVLATDEAASRILAGVAEDRFLIYTHPELHEYVVRKAQDPERWVAGMRRLWARAQVILSS
jgi:NAD(P)-dependent dehydrogenase (short-subunit alcohol dehydrogenase family)